MRKGEKRVSDTERLARFFVMDFLGREALEHRRDGMHLRHAQQLVNPRKGEKAYTVDRVVKTLQAMFEGIFPDWEEGKVPDTLLAVMWGNPPFIDRLDNIRVCIPPQPPYYMKTELKKWNEKYQWLFSEER